MKIDAHQHFWRLDRGDYDWLTPELAPLYRDFGPEDLRPVMEGAGIGGTVLVQAAPTVAETEFMLDLAASHEWILGVVGWVDMEDGAAPEEIARLSRHPKFAGVRPMIQDLADDAWMLRPALAPAVEALIAHGKTFDALVLPRHLDHLMVFLDRYPELRTVIDHCAKPEIRNHGFEPWAGRIASIAGSTGAFCKLSGLSTEAHESQPAAESMPYVDHVLGSFPPERLMFGSDWPVCALAAGYEGWVELLAQGLARRPYTPEQLAMIWGGSAAEFYGLPPR